MIGWTKDAMRAPEGATAGRLSPQSSRKVRVGKRTSACELVSSIIDASAATRGTLASAAGKPIDEGNVKTGFGSPTIKRAPISPACAARARLCICAKALAGGGVAGRAGAPKPMQALFL